MAQPADRGPNHNAFDRRYFESAYGEDYDVRNPPRKVEFYLSEINRVRSAGRLLDIGCAYGNFLAVARTTFLVTGLDVSQHAVDIARTRLPDVEVVRLGVLDLPKDRLFDVITCFDALEHVPQLDEAFQAIRGALVPGGTLALTVPVFDTPIGRVVGLLDRDPTHVWREGRGFWKRKLEENSFSVIRSVGLWRYLFPGRHYLFFGSRLLYRASPAVLFIGGKT